MTEFIRLFSLPEPAKFLRERLINSPEHSSVAEAMETPAGSVMLARDPTRKKTPI
jgi:hypothetical protein